MEVFYSKQKHHVMNRFNIFTPFEVDRAGVTACLKFSSKRGTLAKSKTDLSIYSAWPYCYIYKI